MTAERENKLWDEAIIIFDSSSLLNLYFLPKQTRKSVFENFFAKKLKNRLWIPYHVSFEYLKNRKSVIKKPIADNCKPLKEETLGSIKKSIKTLDDKISDLKNKTRKDDKYPHLPQDDIDNYIKLLDKFKIDSDSFEKSIIKHIEKAENEIKQLENDDDVFDAIEKYFAVGRDFNFNEIIEITKEGKHRYEFSIPPGYKDSNDKIGTQIFGDLIIWKQIIEHAVENKKNIIFICDDIKEDWCYKEEGTEKRIKSPREELIKEIFDIANIEFWMYNLPQFLYKTNEFLLETPEDAIDSNRILNFAQFLNEQSIKETRNKKRPIYKEITQCHECDGSHDGFGNYITSWSENNILNEYIDSHVNSKFHSGYTGSCSWCNTLHIECPKCFSVNSLADHNFNAQIECEGGCGIIFFVESDIRHNNLDSYEIKIIDERIEECKNCGKGYIDTNNIEICDECENQYNK